MKGRMVARFLRASGLGEYMRRKGGGPAGTSGFPSSRTIAQRGVQPGAQEVQRRASDSGTKNYLFPGQLEENHFRPRCSEHGCWVESRFHRSSSPVDGAALAKVFKDGTGQTATGGRGNQGSGGALRVPSAPFRPSFNEGIHEAAEASDGAVTIRHRTPSSRREHVNASNIQKQTFKNSQTFENCQSVKNRQTLKNS